MIRLTGCQEVGSVLHPSTPVRGGLSWKPGIFGVEARWRGAGRLQVGGQDSRQARGQGGGDMGGAGLGMGLGGGVGGCRGGVGLE